MTHSGRLGLQKSDSRYRYLHVVLTKPLQESTEMIAQCRLLEGQQSSAESIRKCELLWLVALRIMAALLCLRGDN